MRLNALSNVPLWAAALALLPGLLAAQLTTRHVKGHIYMLQGPGGNIAVSAGPDGILIVDDKYSRTAEQIKAALADLDKGDLQFILNTHYHGDHTGSNAFFGGETPILAHENVRRRLMDEGKPAKAWPVITFPARLSVHFNGERVRAVHYPSSHTDGDIVVAFTGSNVVALGDLFFSGMFPYVDIPGGGRVSGLIESLDDILEHFTAEVLIIPGHGPLSDLDDLRSYRDMIVQTSGLIRAEMAQGRSVAQTQRKGLPRKWASWSWNFITEARWIEIVYESYGLEGAGP